METMPSFWPLYQQLKTGKFIDLTHSFDSTIPHFEPAKEMQMTEVKHDHNEGFLVQYFEFEGQWGTHVDAPSHSSREKKTLDQIPVEEMILPLVVIDIHEKVKQNPDYILLVDDIIQWEDTHKRIPFGAFVALRTDWSKRWPDHRAMHNVDSFGISHTPGWSLDALCYLYDDCQITASGHETINTDPGMRAEETNWMCERFILERNHYQIELLTNLDQCPPAGALVVCSFPKPRGASGFPARVFAICPIMPCQLN
ncbi:MAG: cyclase family protein [Parachlamydiaceae bacterium]